MAHDTAVLPGRSSSDGDAWLIDGQPIEDGDLRRRLDEALAVLCEACTDLSSPLPGATLAFATAQAVLDTSLDRLGEELEVATDGPRIRSLITHATRLNALQRELSEAHLAHRSRAISRVQDALARLRDVASIDQILQIIPAEVLNLGFTRVILSRVRDSLWVPEVVLVDGDPDWAAQILRAGRDAEQPLDHMVLETEMVRRRVPMLVRDVQNDPRAHQAIASTSLSRSYVTAPIMPEGRVIGFIHADCYTAGRHVDEFDRDLLWLFAEGAGYAFERTVLKERLAELRERAGRLTEAIGDVIDEAVGAEIEVARLERRQQGRDEVPRAAPRTVLSPSSRVHMLLTRREVEIAQLMSAGATNGEIARKLIITEGTVKTHVSHILRKLRAANRAQAVSTFIRLSQANGS